MRTKNKTNVVSLYFGWPNSARVVLQKTVVFVKVPRSVQSTDRSF